MYTIVYMYMAYVTNRTARRDYDILDTVRAGISLLGTEVKSVRDGKASLAGARVLIRGGEAFLVGATIPPHQEKNARGYDPERTRRLLLQRKEIVRLHTQTEMKGLTLVPIRVYNCNRVLKVDVGIARKRHARDKREVLKKRDTERSIRRQLRH